MKTRITCTLDQTTLARLRKIVEYKHYTITQQVIQWIWAEEMEKEIMNARKESGAYDQEQ